MSGRQEISMPATQALFEELDAVEAVRVGNTVYVSGQVGWDEGLKPGKDLATQARLAFRNLKAVLEKAGANPEHLTHLQLFFVDPGKDTPLSELAQIVFKEKKAVLPGCRCAGTGVMVQALFLPELLLEIQATAVVS